jgi:hypothetical protein
LGAWRWVLKPLLLNSSSNHYQAQEELEEVG